MTSIQKSPLMRTALKALSPLALLLLLPAAAHAQAAEGAPPQASSESIWIKVCSTDQASKQKVCITRADLRGENGSFVSSVTIQQVGDEKRYGVGVLMPLGVLLPAGVKLAVDGAALATAQFTICLPQPPICVGSVAAQAEFIDAFRKGGKVTMTAQNSQGKDVKLDVSLIGFSKVFDGEGIDPQQAEARQKELNDALQKRAEEARQKLIEQQKQSQ
jgi:invasion protein IalB